MKNTIIVALSITLMGLLFLQTCTNDTENGTSKDNTEIVREVITETVYDTIRVELSSSSEFTREETDTSSYKDTTGTQIYNYTKDIETILGDDTLTAVISTNTFGDNLKDIKIDWQFNPTLLHKNVKILDKTEKKTYIVRNKLYAGLETTITPELHSIYLGLDLAHKKGFILGASIGYDFRLNQKLFKINYKKIIRL